MHILVRDDIESGFDKDNPPRSKKIFCFPCSKSKSHIFHHKLNLTFLRSFMRNRKPKVHPDIRRLTHIDGALKKISNITWGIRGENEPTFISLYFLTGNRTKLFKPPSLTLNAVYSSALPNNKRSFAKTSETSAPF